MTGPESPYALRPATAAEIDYIRNLNAEMWAKDLSVETYHERERTIGSTTLTRNGGIRSWVLVNPNSDRPNDILSSCETIRKHTLISRPPAPHTKEARVFEADAQVIGSVFTPKEHRGRGYAGILMALLKEKLMRENQEGLSVLYSDIGKKFYAKHGWMPHASAHIEFPVDGAGPVEDVRYLHSSDLHSLCDKDVQALRQKLQKPETHLRVAILPDWKTMEWHHAREEFVAPHARPNIRKKPERKGAISADEKRWIIWNRDFMCDQPTLYILRVANMSEGQGPMEGVWEISKLFKAALNEAKNWGLEKVVLWNPDDETIEAAKLASSGKVEYVERDTDSIPSLMMHTGESGMEHVEWLGNEKYAWC